MCGVDLLAVGRRAAHLVSYWIARKVNDPKYVALTLGKSQSGVGSRLYLPVELFHGSEIARSRL
jgi:hypothetical protein